MSKENKNLKAAMRAMDLCREYLVQEGKLDNQEILLAGIWIFDFFLIADMRGWPVIDPKFPEILRAMAICLDTLHKEVEFSGHKSGSEKHENSDD